MLKASLIGTVQVMSAALMWGTLGIFGKMLGSLGVQPTAMVAIRLLIAFSCLSFFSIVFKKRLPVIRSQDVVLFIIYVLTSVVAYNFLYFSAISLIPIAVAAILLYLSPVFVTLIAVFFYKEKFTFLKGLSLFVILTGIALVLDLGASANINKLGLLYGLGAGVTFALYSVLGKELMKHNKPFDVVQLSFGLGGLCLLLISVFQSGINFSFSLPSWILLVLLGLGPTLAAFLLYNQGLEKIPASKASIFSTIEPITAAVLGAIFLSERLSMFQSLGIVMVLVGIFITSKSKA